MDFTFADDLSSEQADQLVRETVENFNSYLNRWPDPRTVAGAVVEWFGEGCILRDVHGREFIDCLGGFGVFARGHRHPKVVNAFRQQIDRIAHHFHRTPNPRSADAAQPLAGLTPSAVRVTRG